jgi:hypothetical protein
VKALRRIARLTWRAEMTSDEQPVTEFIVPVSEWSDGTPASMERH